MKFVCNVGLSYRVKVMIVSCFSYSQRSLTSARNSTSRPAQNLVQPLLFLNLFLRHWILSNIQQHTACSQLTFSGGYRWKKKLKRITTKDTLCGWCHSDCFKCLGIWGVVLGKGKTKHWQWICPYEKRDPESQWCVCLPRKIYVKGWGGRLQSGKRETNWLL